jgi:hypothetical protein
MNSSFQILLGSEESWSCRSSDVKPLLMITGVLQAPLSLFLFRIAHPAYARSSYSRAACVLITPETVPRFFFAMAHIGHSRTSEVVWFLQWTYRLYLNHRSTSLPTSTLARKCALNEV